VTAPQSPSARLEAAAGVLERLASKATPGPWRAVRHDREGFVGFGWMASPLADDLPAVAAQIGLSS